MGKAAIVRIKCALAAILVAGAFGCGGGSDHTSTRTLTAIAIAPTLASIPKGLTQQFTASGTFSDGTTQDLTKSAAWSSSDPTIATIDSSGLATSVAPGIATIIATSAGVSASTALTVGPPVSVSVSPGVASVTFTQTQQFQATVSNTINGSVTWSVDGVAGGDATAGTITSSGLYTPPMATGSHQVTAASQVDPGKSASASLMVTDYPGTFTYHNDNGRTGQNLKEIVLTPQNVNSAQFGKLFSYPVDGAIYAQPLYVENVNVPGSGFHNLVFVATEHDSVYAFDADGLAADPLWHTSFINQDAGVTTVPCADETRACIFFGSEIGITGTPVIDPTSGTLYVSAFTKEAGNYVHRLHALDITTGAEQSDSPVEIEGSVPGSGDGSDGQNVAFDAFQHLQRPGLLLANGVVYIGFGSFADTRPYHGWLFGYDEQTLAQVGIFNTTPNGDSGAIWQAGGAPAADVDGDVFVMTGNGTFDASSGGSDFGDSIPKLVTTGAGLSVVDYFTPFNQADLNAGDTDLGSGGPLLVPDQTTGPPHLLIGAGKEGKIYVVDRDHMSGFNSGGDEIVQSLPNAVGQGAEDRNFSTPAYWQGNVYFQGVDDTLKLFQLTAGLLSSQPISQSASTVGFPGATPSISADSLSNGIVWILEPVTQFVGTDFQSAGPAVLHAYDATDVAHELYNSNQAGVRDVPGSSVKFAVPTVANGKVYVGTGQELDVYGLLP
jgi:Bacterial Ig-like domain (group 2)